ncbi:MAG: hypothetical protein ACJ8MH_17355, partial [Povalibacter sp.]
RLEPWHKAPEPVGCCKTWYPSFEGLPLRKSLQLKAHAASILLSMDPDILEPGQWRALVHKHLELPQ